MGSSAWGCYVINLDRSPHRLSSISAQLSGLNIPFQRFAAIDGHTLDLSAGRDFDARRYEKRHGKTISACEIGCFLSHIGVLRAFLASAAPYCLILEDDAMPDGTLGSVLAGLEKTANDWDVALLYGNYSALPQAVTRLDESHELVGFLARQSGAVAYAVNRKAAAIYLEKLLPMSLPIDIDFDRAWDFGIRFRGVAPFPIRTGRHASDIGRTGRKFAWHRRLATYARRGWNELRRYRHYALRDPVWLQSLRYRFLGRRNMADNRLPSAGSAPEALRDFPKGSQASMSFVLPRARDFLPGA